MLSQDHIDQLDAMLCRLDQILERLGGRLDRRAKHDAEWNESDHPRASDGKFGSGGASGAKSPSSPLSKHAGLKPTAEVRQPHASWAALSTAAHEARAQFVAILDKLPAAEIIVAPNKSEARAAEKVKADYKGDWSKLKDVVRGTVVTGSNEEMYAAVEKALGSGLKLAAQPKDRFAKPTPEGYSDINLLVELPNGMVAELQFNTQRMLAAKEKGHALYEEQRSLQAKNGEDEPSERWSERDTKLFNEVRQKQQAIYAKARE